MAFLCCSVHKSDSSNICSSNANVAQYGETKNALISFPGPLCSFGLDYTGMSYLRGRLEEPVSMGTETMCSASQVEEL